MKYIPLCLKFKIKWILSLGVKNIFELEGIMNSRTCSFNFLNRSLPIFPLVHYRIKPGKMAYVKVRVPFVEKLSGIAIVKLLYKYHIGTMRVRIDHNQSIIKIINNTDETIHYSPQLSMGIVDIRSLGYYNVSKSICCLIKEVMIESLHLHINHQNCILKIIIKLEAHEESNCQSRMKSALIRKLKRTHTLG